MLINKCFNYLAPHRNYNYKDLDPLPWKRRAAELLCSNELLCYDRFFLVLSLSLIFELTWYTFKDHIDIVNRRINSSSGNKITSGNGCPVWVIFAKIYLIIIWISEG